VTNTPRTTRSVRSAGPAAILIAAGVAALPASASIDTELQWLGDNGHELGATNALVLPQPTEDGGDEDPRPEDPGNIVHTDVPDLPPDKGGDDNTATVGTPGGGTGGPADDPFGDPWFQGPDTFGSVPTLPDLLGPDGPTGALNPDLGPALNPDLGPALNLDLDPNAGQTGFGGLDIAPDTSVFAPSGPAGVIPAPGVSGLLLVTGAALAARRRR